MPSSPDVGFLNVMNSDEELDQHPLYDTEYSRNRGIDKDQADHERKMRDIYRQQKKRFLELMQQQHEKDQRIVNRTHATKTGLSDGTYFINRPSMSKQRRGEKSTKERFPGVYDKKKKQFRRSLHQGAPRDRRRTKRQNIQNMKRRETVAQKRLQPPVTTAPAVRPKKQSSITSYFQKMKVAPKKGKKGKRRRKTRRRTRSKK